MILLSLVLLPQSCATTRYEPIAETTDKEVTQLNDSVFRVEYRVSPFTSQAAPDGFLRRRCAEVTLQQGYDYFGVGERVDALTYRRSTSVILKMYKGQKPAGTSLLYDAREVLELSVGQK
jgi:hypothetical protein